MNESRTDKINGILPLIIELAFLVAVASKDFLELFQMSRDLSKLILEVVWTYSIGFCNPK